MTFLTLAGLRKRGWTDAMVRDLLGQPDVQGRDPRRWSVAPVRLYLLARVQAVERAPEFAACATAARGAAAARVAAERRRQAVLAAIRAEPIRVPILPEAELERRAVRHRRLLDGPRGGGMPDGNGAATRRGAGGRGGAGRGGTGGGGAASGGTAPGGSAPGGAGSGGAGLGGTERDAAVGGVARPGGATPGGAAAGGALVRWQVDYLRHALSRYDALLDGLFGATGRAEAERLLRERVYRAIAQAYPRLAAECARRIR
ncbi:hypothetical protein [Streptomyces ficellus]|nr:hypothetical protein [Streptomyces ficellus]